MKPSLFFSLLSILYFCPFTILKGQENKTDSVSLCKEAHLDSLWRKENIWNLGVTKITGKPIKDLSTKEAPQWAKWGFDLEKYFVSQMRYPTHLLNKNQAGYSVAMFSLDTLGLPRAINILTTIHKDFDKEVVRLIRELPHCLPCRDRNGKRIECLYTVYVPFLPQQYKNRVIADSIAEEELKHCFVEWEEPASFQDGNPHAVQNYIYSKLKYNSDLLYKQEQVRGIYSMFINSYGKVTETKTLQSCGIQEWDSQVEKIIKGMPRWTPTINYYGKGEYRSSVWTVPVVFKNITTTEEFSILTAHTSEPYLEMGVPVCYLNGRGDTIISYGKYKFCQTDTIRSIGFVYKNRSQDTRIVCINNAGKELFYVFEYDNGPDYVQEGLFRIMDEKGLVGFADTSGNVIIKPQFKFAFPFKDGKARVTLKGERKEVPESNGEKFYWESDEWFYINQKNIRLTK